MCGIVGAAAQRDIVPVLIEGLRRLEYRGYDSCGVATLVPGGLDRLRSVARVADLAGRVAQQKMAAETGIAHTRWATHGAPLTQNAHPMFSRGEIALVHNGIIENYEELRAELKAQGYVFDSQTDTEVIAHLVHSYYTGDLFDAVRAAVKRLAGAYAIAVLSSREPHTVVGARAGSPLVIGEGDGEMFLASDALALAGTTERIAYLRKATSRKSGSTASGSSMPRTARYRARFASSRRRAPRPTSARTATSCRKRFSSSHAQVADTLEGDRHALAGALRRRRRQNAGRRRFCPAARVRDQLLRRADSEKLDRVACAAADAGRDRQRIPLPRQRAERERAGGGHFAIGRDRRHAGGAQACALARPGRARSRSATSRRAR
jgi:asparagine synthetase B (glutamine-hydrolysing)